MAPSTALALCTFAATFTAMPLLPAGMSAHGFGMALRHGGQHHGQSRVAAASAMLARRRLLQEMDNGADDDVRPAPASIGTDVPLSYFGPAPSDVDRRLIGPFQLLKSGVVDEDAGTVTIPIYYGVIDGAAAGADDGDGGYGDAPRGATPGGGKGVYYVVTDTTDGANAEALGLNHSPKLTYANVGNAARQGYLDSDLIVHWEAGDVDFSPERTVEPGDESPFPPSTAEPGAVGDESYTPLLYLANAGAHVYNAPIVASGATGDELRAYCDGIPEGQEAAAKAVLHDKVVAVCPDESGLGGTVTLSLTPGWSFARPVLYLSMDASTPDAAAIEDVTFAPALATIMVGADDTLFSAAERIFIFVNGFTNEDIGGGNATVDTHPLRQGLNSALLGEGPPLNVLGGIATIATDYSPLWDANVGVWTDEAVDHGFRTRLTEEFAILGMADKGLLTGPDGAEYGSVGFIVNCPIVQRFL